MSWTILRGWGHLTDRRGEDYPAGLRLENGFVLPRSAVLICPALHRSFGDLVFLFLQAVVDRLPGGPKLPPPPDMLLCDVPLTVGRACDLVLVRISTEYSVGDNTSLP